MSNVDNSEITMHSTLNAISDAQYLCNRAIESVKSCRDAQSLRDLECLRQKLEMIEEYLNPFVVEELEEMLKDSHN